MNSGSEFRLRLLSVIAIALAAVAYDPQAALAGQPSGCSPEQWMDAHCAAEAACNNTPPILPGGCMQGSASFCWLDEGGQPQWSGGCWELPAELCPMPALPCE